MGNKSSIIIPSHFEGEITPCREKVGVFLHLPNPVASVNGKTYSKIFVLLNENDEVSLHGSIPKDCENVRRIEWRPKTHMRDTEYIYPLFLKSEEDEKVTIVKRGEGVGVIICESLGMYVKIVYDRKSKIGVNILLLKEWERSSSDLSILKADLSMGYDVLVIRKNTHLQLCEDIDERDTNGTVAFTPYSIEYPIDEFDQ